MKKILYTEQIFVIENFLSTEECKNFIQKSEEIGFEEAKVQVGNNRQAILKGVRNNDRILYNDPVLAAKMYELAKEFLPQGTGLYEICGLNELFRFYKYSPGQRFKMHRDGSFVRNEKEESFYTFMIYLNDDFEGGETEFESICTVKPKTGDLLVFLHPLRHEGKALLSGIKYVLRSDVMYKLRENE